MPPKKKLALGRKTPAAQRMSVSRADETSQQTQERLLANRQSRAAETPQQTQSRLQADQERHREQRAAETPQQIRVRLQADQMRYAYRRGTIWADMRNAAFQYDPNVQYGLTRLLLIGRMEKQCEHCSALKYEGERPGMCCSGGKVRIPDLPAPPEELRALLDGSSPHSTDFLKHIRYYNNAFQMTSFGCDKRVTEPGYMPTFKIQGQVYHTIGSLLPPFNEDNLEAQPVFLQVFLWVTVIQK